MNESIHMLTGKGNIIEVAQNTRIEHIISLLAVYGRQGYELTHLIKFTIREAE